MEEHHIFNKTNFGVRRWNYEVILLLFPHCSQFILIIKCTKSRESTDPSYATYRSVTTVWGIFFHKETDKMHINTLGKGEVNYRITQLALTMAYCIIGFFSSQFMWIASILRNSFLIFHCRVYLIHPLLWHKLFLAFLLCNDWCNDSP